uniref:Uncharacterized protein n=1 Tax=Romanomermis culicivorax TaxID=13658 RepID=A0A915JQH3_ROMCU
MGVVREGSHCGGQLGGYQRRTVRRQPCWWQWSQWQQVPPGKEIVAAQQGYGMVSFAVVLNVNPLDIGNFR